MIEDEEDDLIDVEEPVASDQQDDAADPKRKARKDRRLAREQREAEDFWDQLFATRIGRREMYKLLTAGGFSETKFACGPTGFPQPEATWFEAGKKSFVVGLYESWQVLHHEQVFLMLCENDPRYAAAKKRLGIE